MPGFVIGEEYTDIYSVDEFYLVHTLNGYKVYVDITWMRVLVKLLKEWREDIKQNEEICITFNGEFTIFKCGGLSIPIPGKGKKWRKIYFVDFTQLANIPVRIFNRGCQFIINGEKLTFGNKVLIIRREVLKDKNS